MSLSLSARNAYIRNQAGVFISCCNQILDNLGSRCIEDEPARSYLLSRLSILSREFFSAKEVFTLEFQRTQDGRFSQINEDLGEVISILQGESDLYPLPIQYADGEGELKEEIEEEDLRGILALLQKGVEEKIRTLCFELKQDPGALTLRSNVESFEKIYSPKQAIAILEKHNSKVFRFFSEEIRASERVGVVAVKLFPQNFQFLNAELKKKEFIALLAISKDPSLFIHVDVALKENLLFITKAIKLVKQECLAVLLHLSDELRDRFEVFDLALTYNKSSLMYGSERLKANTSLIKKQKQQKKTLFCRFFRGQLNLETEMKNPVDSKEQEAVTDKFKQLKFK